jgi:hypothetical protein
MDNSSFIKCYRAGAGLQCTVRCKTPGEQVARLRLEDDFPYKVITLTSLSQNTVAQSIGGRLPLAHTQISEVQVNVTDARLAHLTPKDACVRPAARLSQARTIFPHDAPSD